MSMSRLITTCIPLHQPGGRLTVPADEWAALRSIVEDAGGQFEFAHATRRGYIYGEYRGLPVYAIGILLDDEVDAASVVGPFDVALKALIARNLTPEHHTDTGDA